LLPLRKDYIWGVESWVLSCHPDGMSYAESGVTLAEFIKNSSGVLGKNCEKFDRFPIIVKLIDAEDNLSVQVHPNNEQGEKDGDWGKSELWFILDALPDSEIIYGLNREITREEFRGRIESGALFDVLNRVKVKKGDAYFIPAGTLHSVGKGVLIAEVQQSSNLTYRAYDYGRGRELHIDRVVETARLTPSINALNINCEYFSAKKFAIAGETPLFADISSFNSLLITEGEAEIDGLLMKKGEACFITAGYGEYTVNGKAELIYIKV